MKLSPSLKHIALVGVLSLALIISGKVIAWQAPTSSPTGGNVPAPVNTGSVQQTKTGTLRVLQNLIADLQITGGQIRAVTDLRVVGVDGNNSFGQVIGRKLCLAGNFSSALIGNPNSDPNINCISSWSDIAGTALPPGNGSQTLFFDGLASQWKATSVLRVVDDGTQVFNTSKRVIISPKGGPSQNQTPQNTPTQIVTDFDGRVQIRGGDPDVMKVLTASGTDGQATWSDLPIEFKTFITASTTAQATAYCGRNYANGNTIVDTLFLSPTASPGYNRVAVIGGGLSCGSTLHTLNASHPVNTFGAPVNYQTYVDGNTVGGSVANAWSGRCSSGANATATVICVRY